MPESTSTTSSSSSSLKNLSSQTYRRRPRLRLLPRTSRAKPSLLPVQVQVQEKEKSPTNDTGGDPVIIKSKVNVVNDVAYGQWRRTCPSFYEGEPPKEAVKYEENEEEMERRSKRRRGRRRPPNPSCLYVHKEDIEAEEEEEPNSDNEQVDKEEKEVKMDNNFFSSLSSPPSPSPSSSTSRLKSSSCCLENEILNTQQRQQQQQCSEFSGEAQEEAFPLHQNQLHEDTVFTDTGDGNGNEREERKEDDDEDGDERGEERTRRGGPVSRSLLVGVETVIRLLGLLFQVTRIGHYWCKLSTFLSPLMRVRCQISQSVRSDFVCIIIVILCLLSPVVTPVITSNAILPMDLPEIILPVEGVVGKRFEMGCDLKPSRRDDSVYMVLWFREDLLGAGDLSLPIYTLDVRGKPFSGAKRISADVPFGKRAHFSTELARLIVQDARATDQGMYRCRVDFRSSPSREQRINLTIIVPPEQVIIMEPTGLHHITEMGPYPEGHSLTLQCRVSGGIPRPIVQWYLNDEPLQPSSTVVQSEREVISEVKITLHRSLHRSILSCKASNTILLQPITSKTVIDMNLRPLTVAIQHRNSQLSTDTQYEITCESWGANPPATITWFLDNVKLNASTEETRSSNSSVSRLLFNPTSSVDGQLLTCRSENTILPASAIEDSWRLKVVYNPVLSLRMGSSLNPNDIKESDDVYFECKIKSNPPFEKLYWYHNGAILHHNRSAGVILSNQSLVLQKVSRPSAGNYSCKAFNSQGVGYSNEVRLEIMYAPACQAELSGTDAVIIAASRSEDVNISCEMDALPDNLKFYWTHTNTVGENSDIVPEIYSSQGSKSLLRYHLRSEEDFGTLLCWASNSIGSAERPCVYQLVPADCPQPVENCSVTNRTSTSVEITCEAGFDGGLPQSFLLEAYQSVPASRRGLQYNMTSSTPTFSLTGLDADGTFHFKIYSVNRKGRSSPSIMDGIALHYPAMQSAKVRDLEKTTIAIIIGALSAVVLSSVSLIAFIIHRRKHPITEEADMDKSYNLEFRSSRRSSTNDELYHNNSKKIHDHPSSMETTYPSATTDFDEDGDPDLIPSKNVKTSMGMGKTSYCRLSNGEMNQGYGGTRMTMTTAMEKVPLRPMNPSSDVPLSMEHSTLSNYATFRGKPNVNGLGLKPQPPARRETHHMASVSSSGSFHGKPSSVVVNIDTRLIGQQLASNQLPESCV